MVLEAESVRSLQIEHGFVLRRGFDRKVGWIGPAQNPIDVRCRPPEMRDEVIAVNIRPAAGDKIAERVDFAGKRCRAARL